MTPAIELLPVVGGCGYVYVIAFSNGTVKVGKTTEPATRFASHANTAASFDIHITGWWLTDEHSSYSRTEQAAIAAADALLVSPATKTRREYFHGLDVNDVVAACAAIGLAQAPMPVPAVSIPSISSTQHLGSTLQRLSDDIADEHLAGHVTAALTAAVPWLELPTQRPVSKAQRGAAFGQILAHGRTRMGLSQDQFADAVSMSRTTVSRWERGMELSPKLGPARRVFKTADVHMATAVVALGNSTISRIIADPRRY
jgi:DNA-binding XRE family transcriptional regulator